MKRLFKNLVASLLIFALVSSAVLLKPSSTQAQFHSLLCDAASTTETLITAILSVNPAWNWITSILPKVDMPGGVWYDQTVCGFTRKVLDPSNADEMFGERYTYAQVNWIANSLFLQSPFGFFFRVETPELLQRFIDLIVQGKEPSFADFSQLGPLGLAMGSMSSMISHPPASGVESVQNTLAEFNLASPAQAQGFGYTALSPLSLLWKASRNMAYLIMVILLVASGFMIMFRVKINPQTAVTLQLMIPKIVFTLLLVTFSYAIAGFVFDLVYVVLMFILSGLSIAPNNVITDLNTARNFFLTPGVARLFVYYVIQSFVIMNQLLPFIGTIIGIVLALVTAWLVFKIWWMMVKTYLVLIILVIAGPWQIMLGLIPNVSGFGSWFKNLIANAAVFVVTPLMFLLNIIFWTGNGFSTLVSGVRNDPLVGLLPQLPMFGATSSPLIAFGLGYACLALTPKAAEMVRNALKISEFKYGSAIGVALSEPTGFMRSSWGDFSARQQRAEDLAFRRAQMGPEEYAKAHRFGSQGVGYEVSQAASRAQAPSQAPKPAAQSNPNA